VNGIGFLGAGSIIITSRNRIKGLTTAAGIWACACVGLSIGIGFYTASLIGFAIVFFSILFFFITLNYIIITE
jgi:putative Mg2+ transporter-C (MgtC) family protein